MSEPYRSDTITQLKGLLAGAERDLREEEKWARHHRDETSYHEAEARRFRGRVDDLNRIIAYAETLAVPPKSHLAVPESCFYAGDLELAACRMCGCTEDKACEGGCRWVPDPAGEGDLCSSCEPRAREGVSP